MNRISEALRTGSTPSATGVNGSVVRLLLLADEFADDDYQDKRLLM